MVFDQAPNRQSYGTSTVHPYGLKSSACPHDSKGIKMFAFNQPTCQWPETFVNISFGLSLNKNTKVCLFRYTGVGTLLYCIL